MMVIEGVPFRYPAVRMFCVESETSATIGEPDCLPFVVSDDQRTKLVGMEIWSFVTMSAVVFPSEIWPAGS